MPEARPGKQPDNSVGWQQPPLQGEQGLLDALASALLEKETLDADEIDTILAPPAPGGAGDTGREAG